MMSEEVKTLRQILGLTQPELAERIGVSFRTIQNYEAGGVIPPAKRKLLSRMIAEARGNTANVEGSTGNINTGQVGGNIINIADPLAKKISEGAKVVVERDLPVEIYIQTIEILQGLFADLKQTLILQKSDSERTIEARDAHIKDLQKMLESKDALINVLLNNKQSDVR